MLSPGQPAPDFLLPDETGMVHTLADLRKNGPVVLYFYPKDHTAGCTAEACSFRDHHAEFEAAGARVVGVSGDGGASHKSFREKHELPFLLLSDPSGTVAARYGVKKTFGLLPGRATFVIDRHGVVALAYSSQLRFLEHVDQALEVVQKLSREG